MIKIELDPKRIAEFVDAIEKGRLVAPPRCRCMVYSWSPMRIKLEAFKDRTDRTNGTYENKDDRTDRTDGTYDRG